ncbi:MAG: tyrosine-type recombinase/integrase [Acidimicrobiales bacterium]
MASVEKRPSGQWRARWREYPGGPQRTKQFVRKVDAERHLVAVQHDLLTGGYVDPVKGKTTVADFYAVWSARQPWRPSSRAAVESLFRTHVLPSLGARPLNTIRRGDVEGWGAGLALSGRTAGQTVQHLGTMLDAAVADGLLATNPARGAKRPAVADRPVVPFSGEELDRLRSAAPTWFAVAVTLGASCGLRQGEATGLTVDRIGFLRRELTVDRQLVTPGRGEPGFGPLKTSRSYRTVPLADVAVAELARHLEGHGVGEGGLVLHEGGRPVPRQRFGRVWRSLRVRADLPEAHFHDTRHTYASVLLSGGVSVPAVADYLGHSPAVLLRTYAHLMPAEHDRARSAVEAAFARPAEDWLRTTAED